MEDRAAIRKLLLRSRREADAHMETIRSADPLTYDLLHEELYRYILVKFLLTDEDRPENDSFADLTELSLAKSMKVSPALVEEFDTAQSCDGATSDERSDGFSHAGRPTPRSARGHSLLQASFEAPRRSFTVLGGGREGRADSVERRERPGRREAYREGMAARGTERANSPEALRREREERARSKGARYTTDRNGRRRIDLGPSAGDRLRKDDSRPEVRGTNYDLGDRRSGRRGR